MDLCAIRSPLPCILAGLIVSAFPIGAADNPVAAVPVGVAVVDITPDYPVRLSGFGFRRTESEGITQRIHAKAMAFGQDTDGPVILITADTLCVPDEITKEIANRLQAKAGVRRDRLSITSSHTHTAPMLRNTCPTLFGVPIPDDHLAHINRYTDEFTDKLEKVALAALKDLRPSTVSWTTGKVTFAVNRRTKGGPVDHDLPVMVIKDDKDVLRAIYFSYACHCVTLSNNKISGDWAGWAQEDLEKRRPGCVVLASVGCGADSNPSTGVTGERIAAVEDQGKQIADEIERLLTTTLTPLPERPQTRYGRVDLPFDTPRTRQEWETRAKSQDAIGHHARVNLAKLDRGESLPTGINYPVQTWLFGGKLAMVFLPGETVVDYSLRLKRELDRTRLWVNGYSNDARCYIPGERVLKEGGYEGGDAMIYYDMPQKFAPGLEQKIIDVVKAQVPQSFRLPSVAEAAHLILDESAHAPDREAAIKVHAGDAAELIVEMTRNLGNDSKAEYARIPWIWRVAVACGRSNDAALLLRLLDASLPKEGEPLRDWQAVVIGGGVINGLSQAHLWPSDRVAEIIGNDSSLHHRWQRALDLASPMADDERIPQGTRYDALRILGVEPWSKRGAQLTRYLAAGSPDELQMGAVSALVDIKEPEAVKALLDAWPHLTADNRKLAADGMLRSKVRAQAVLDAVGAGKITIAEIDPEQLGKLRALTSKKSE